ncbi:9899_t:CDS:2 [Acaulospora morrowiae]|uniref:9899_t:CDS:1 n=1 Tax=Acaulospora morrowiae TaxID=94023 RepID=A0A9N8VYT1_9GLOM|nr:9899_t:CDS:2 [Acaulospora morrowiae]
MGNCVSHYVRLHPLADVTFQKTSAIPASECYYEHKFSRSNDSTAKHPVQNSSYGIGDDLRLVTSPAFNSSSMPSTPGTPNFLSFQNYPFLPGVASQATSLTNRPRTLKFTPKSGGVGTRLIVHIYIELPGSNYVLSMAFGDMMVETQQVAMPDSCYELVAIVPSQEDVKSANRTKVPVNVMICNEFNIPIDKWHLGDFVFKGVDYDLPWIIPSVDFVDKSVNDPNLDVRKNHVNKAPHRHLSKKSGLYHPYVVDCEPTPPISKVSSPLNENDADAYIVQSQAFDSYSYDDSVRETPTFSAQNYRVDTLTPMQSDTTVSVYSSACSTPSSMTDSDDSRFERSPTFTKDENQIPIYNAPHTTISTTWANEPNTAENLPSATIVKSTDHVISPIPGIPPGLPPLFPPSLYPYLYYPVIPSITLKESPVVPSSGKPAPSTDSNLENDCKTQLQELLNRVKLNVDGDIQTMARDWTEKDFKNRRRLVQFMRRVEGDEINVSFKAVDPEERPRYGIFVSCIWWEAKDDYYITSVDCIYLLECLTGIRLTQDEKNRIRRNLEIFKPLTVGKNKRDSEDLFRVIMSFPNPKPRNIEKDVKVFPWSCVMLALNKILRKYMNAGGNGQCYNGGNKFAEGENKLNLSSLQGNQSVDSVGQTFGGCAPLNSSQFFGTGFHLRENSLAIGCRQ